MPQAKKSASKVPTQQKKTPDAKTPDAATPAVITATPGPDPKATKSSKGKAPKSKK